MVVEIERFVMEILDPWNHSSWSIGYHQAILGLVICNFTMRVNWIV